MKVQIDRSVVNEPEEPTEVKRKIEIWVGEIKYTINEVYGGELEIQKYDPNDSSAIAVYPSVTNQIRIK